jgi:hypothetical protein
MANDKITAGVYLRNCCSQRYPDDASHHSVFQCFDAVLQDGKPNAIQLHGDLSYADDYQVSAAHT